MISWGVPNTSDKVYVSSVNAVGCYRVDLAFTIQTMPRDLQYQGVMDYNKIQGEYSGLHTVAGQQILTSCLCCCRRLSRRNHDIVPGVSGDFGKDAGRYVRRVDFSGVRISRWRSSRLGCI